MDAAVNSGQDSHAVTHANDMMAAWRVLSVVLHAITLLVLVRVSANLQACSTTRSGLVACLDSFALRITQALRKRVVRLTQALRKRVALRKRCASA